MEVMHVVVGALRQQSTLLAMILSLGVMPIISIVSATLADVSLIPLSTMSTPWTLITASFVEKNIGVMCVHCALGVGA